MSFLNRLESMDQKVRFILFFLGILRITQAAGVSCDRAFYAYNPDTGRCERCDFCCVLGNSNRNFSNENECHQLFQGDLPSGCFDPGYPTLCPSKTYFKAANVSTTAVFHKGEGTSAPQVKNFRSSNDSKEDANTIWYIVASVVAVFVAVLFAVIICLLRKKGIIRFLRDKCKSLRYPTQETGSGQNRSNTAEGNTENLLSGQRTERIEISDEENELTEIRCTSV